MEFHSSQLPVGALAFCSLKHHYLLVGEGAFLKIFRYPSGELVGQERVFVSAVVRGISVDCVDADKISPLQPLALAWGGRSVSVVEIIEPDEAAQCIAINICMKEIQTTDWIHHATLTSSLFWQPCLGTNQWLALCVTAHNELLAFYEQPDDTRSLPATHESKCLARGPRSMLSSADLCILEGGRTLIASGTVTGEIILWSASTSLYEQTCRPTKVGHTLRGHQGSVFGVQISKCEGGSAKQKRLLASCSDDRAIRIWDASGFESESFDLQVSKVPLAVVTGHASRIWSIRFLHCPGKWPDIVSFGEDGTSQTWAVQNHLARNQQSERVDEASFKLSHGTTYSFHTGKHIFGAALFCDAGEWHLATGGADSRIVSYVLRHSSGVDLYPIRSSISEALSSAQLSNSSPRKVYSSERSQTRSVFDAMTGEWNLSRDITSRSLTQPSGRFIGKAVLQARAVTSRDFDSEMLYSEQGKFSSNSGLEMRANRQYVYRYQASTDQISVWFVKLDGEAVDYKFHELLFGSNDIGGPTPQGDRFRLEACGHHLCEQDTYQPFYTFDFVESGIEGFQIEYVVDGPQKAYVSTATYAPIYPETNHMLVHDRENRLSSTGQDRLSIQESFKSYAWTSTSKFLATTEQGRILFGELAIEREATAISAQSKKGRPPIQSVKWQCTDPIPHLRGTSLISVVPSKNVALLTGENGTIQLLCLSDKKIIREIRGTKKLGFLKAEDLIHFKRGTLSGVGSAGIVVFSRGLGEQYLNIHIFIGDSLDFSESYEHNIEAPCPGLQLEFITTSSSFCDSMGLLLEGSRYGELRIKDLHSQAETTFAEIHGTDAITVILPLHWPSSSQQDLIILTGGRDGKVVHRKLSRDAKDTEKFLLETVHISSPTIALAVEGAAIQQSTRNLILWGFNSTRFIVWNETTKQQIMSVECGGSHRQWAFKFHEDTGGGSFVWTKASACEIYYQPFPSHNVLQRGGHGREIKAVAVRSRKGASTEDNANDLIATGAEDTKIYLWRYKDGYFHPTSIMTNHTTGLQRLGWSADGRWLFSSAGYEELMAWRVRSPEDLVYVVCKATCPHITEDRALRVTDFTVSLDVSFNDLADMKPNYIIKAIYSDSSMRVWRFNVRSKTSSPTFELIATTSYSTCCLTQIVSPDSEQTGISCTTSSDGHLALWESRLGLKNDLKLVKKHRIHQNSIHALMPINTSSLTDGQARTAQSCGSHELQPYNFLLVTGGDDQALAITQCNIKPGEREDIELSSLIVPRAHASAITDAAYLGFEHSKNMHIFATIGTDQRLKIWHLTSEPGDGIGGIRVRKAREVVTSVGDASKVEVLKKSESARTLLVAGIGIEFWDLKGFDM